MESGTLLHTNINERSSVRPTTPCRGTQSNKADLCPMWNGASPPVLMVSGNRRWGVIPACGCRALVSVSESGQENTHKWPAGGQFGSGKLQNQPRTRPKEWAEMPLQSCPRCCSVQLAGGINPRSTIVLEWPSFDWAVSTVVCFFFFWIQHFADIFWYNPLLTHPSFWKVGAKCRLSVDEKSHWVLFSGALMCDYAHRFWCVAWKSRCLVRDWGRGWSLWGWCCIVRPRQER